MSVEERTMALLMENCAVKSVVSGVMGAGVGLAFGLFTASMDPRFLNNKKKNNNPYRYRPEARST
jgi:hypothetical protein